MKQTSKKKSSAIDIKKRFDPSEKEVLCEVCCRPLVVESYKWNKNEGAFFLSQSTELSHEKCMKTIKQ